MPYILVQVTDEDVTDSQKAAIIKGATDLMVDVLGKEPQRTFVVIQEVPLANWGVGGLPVDKFRRQASSG